MSSSPGQTRCAAHLVEARAPVVEPLRGAGAAHGDVGALEVAAVGGAEPGDRLVGVGLAGQRRAQLVDAPDVELALDALRVGVERGVEAALGRRASRAAPSRASPRRRAGTAARRSPASRAGTRERAARCRRASSRSAGPASRGPRSSARSRRRPGRTCRRRPSRAGSGRPCPARRGASGTRAPRRAGTWGRCRSRRWRRRSSRAAPRPPRRAARPAAAPRRGAARRRPGGARRSGVPPARISSRLSRQAWPTASSTSRQLGMPMRDSGGK